MRRSKIESIVYLFILLSFTISTLNYSQNSTQPKSDSLKIGVSSSVNSIKVDPFDVKFTDGTNELIKITDEGTFGAIEIKDGVPSETKNKLYNDGGELKFNGSDIGGNSGPYSVNSLSDARTINQSLFLGTNSGTFDIGTYNGNPNNNIGIGYTALQKIYDGQNNIAIGVGSLNKAQFQANENVAIGTNAGNGIIIGDRNTFIGAFAGGGASYNSGSVFIGYQAGYFSTGNDLLYIDNSNTENPLIWGSFFDGYEKVKINGDFEVIGDKIALGSGTEAIGNYSTAIGKNVKVTGSGSMFLGDGSANMIHNTVIPNIFNARFASGYKLFTNNSLTVGALLDAGGSSWSIISDSTKKENFLPVNGEEVLNKISAFNLRSWNYKSQDPAEFRHYGPMAQEFFNAFGNDGIGIIGNDTTIASADIDGINLIAVQALEKRTREQEISIKYQEQRIKQLEQENEKLISMISEMDIIKAILNKLVNENSLEKYRLSLLESIKNN